MHLKLSSSLHYPITVTELSRRPGDTVSHGDALFSYYYRTIVTEGDGLGNKHDVERTFPTRYECAVDGTLVKWKIKPGDVIEAPIEIAEIDEPCSHDVQFGGMCATCGKDMTHATYNTEVLDSSRAPIRMVHDNAALTVSQDEATRVEEDAKRRLLASRRLSLVVDLDQTIIHATVDPTVGDWKADKDNPNHEAVKDVRAFQLLDDGPGMRGCWYYIKLRPGLEEFLQKISKLYELHIYTMGTRAYAQNIAKIVDPDRKIFGDRILSRDESGSLTAKNLQRLFPVDTKMVVIIDDRGDVWKWTDNLIKVSPYDFFVGIGDINSSFLPKRQDFKPKAGIVVKEPGAEGGSEQGVNGERFLNGNELTASDKPETEVSALEQLVEMGGGDNQALLQEQASQQEETIAHQVEERPLLQRQKQLDAVDEAELAENGDSSSESSQGSARHHRHHLLEDNDTELFRLQERLELIHQQFFEEYDRRRTQSLGGRVTALSGGRAQPKNKDVDLRIVPDIKTIIPRIKRKVLEGVVIVFSGVLPLGTDVLNADISLWTRSFGATVAQKVNSRTTHLVAGRNRTAKVREATRYAKIKIVTVQWLIDSLVHWKRMDEEPYLVPVHPEDRGEPHVPGSSPAIDEPSEDDTSTLSDEESDNSSAQINTDDLENVDEEIRRSSGLDAHSPIGYDAAEQAQVHDELKEFLGSDNEDSESESDFSLPSVVVTDRKRKRDDDTDESVGESERSTQSDAAGDATSGLGSPLARKIKRTHERGTGLREVSNASSGPSSDAHPSSTAPEDGVEMAPGVEGEEAEDQSRDEGDVDDDELEREMLAAFENGDWEQDKPVEEEPT
ncbi:hypothetical protein VTO42DRAFT_5331 [Malbranchea cinnamomea]